MMRAKPGGDLFGLTSMLRSLTASPAVAAIGEARRMARRHLEAGGSVQPPRGGTHHKSGAGDFVLPLDVDLDKLASRIDAMLTDKPHSRPERGVAVPAVQRRWDGRAIVPAEVVRWLGGRRVLNRIVERCRARRLLTKHRDRQ